MDEVVQPKRVVCSQRNLSLVVSLLGMVVLVGLGLWVLKVAAGTVAISAFREIVFTNRATEKRRGLPLLRVFGSEEALVMLTTIAGPEEGRPNYSPQIGRAEWALRRNKWNAEWLYDCALAYWNEAERSQEIVSALERRYAAMPATDTARRAENVNRRARLNRNIPAYRAKAFDYLIRAVGQDPANGFYRWSAAELADVVQADPTVRRNLWQRAESALPGSACLLLLSADRLHQQGKTQETLDGCRKVLEHVGTEFTAGLRDPDGNLIGPLYLGRVIDRFVELLKNYDAYQSYIPDDPEVHHHIAVSLAGRGDTAGAEAERRKVISSGQALIEQRRHSALTLYFMAGAYAAQGKIEECISARGRALKLDPRKKLWWQVQAETQLAAALQAAEQARTLDAENKPDEADVLKSKAREFLNGADESVNRLLSLQASHARATELRRIITGTQTTLPR